MFNPWRGKPDLIVHSEHPYNAEPSLHRLPASMVTAQAEARHRLRVRRYRHAGRGPKCRAIRL